MIRRVPPLLCLLVAVASAAGQEPKPAAAKAGPLDMIPADVVAALAIRNADELVKRGDALIDKTEVKDVPFRLSDGYNWVIDHLGVRRGLDKEGAAALMLLKPIPSDEAVAIAIPVVDWKEMAANYKLTDEDFAEGKVFDRKNQEAKNSPQFVARRGRHLILGGGSAAVERVARLGGDKTLSAVLSAADRKSLAQDDILLYANPRQAGDVWAEAIRIRREDLAKFPPGELDDLKRVAEATDDLKYAIGGVRLADGVGLTVVLQMEGEKSRAILTPLAGDGKTSTSLAGLPTGRVLAAHALAGDGKPSAALARDLVKVLLAHSQIDALPLASAAHRLGLAGVLGHLWQRLEGSRTALYENENPDRDGHFSLVAILDTADGEKFVADMTSLAPFVNASLQPPDAAPAINAATIDALIKQLGDEDFQVRDLATTKLALVGTPALAALEKATQSTDVEVRFRAQSLREQILGSKADLLQRDVLSQIQPSFAYSPKEETRAGRPVDIIQLRLAAEEAEFVPQLRRLLGPEWSKLRLAMVGKRVIVLAGSNTALLDRTIENVMADKPGLAADPRLAGFRATAVAGATAELHVSQARWLQILGPQDGAQPAAGDDGSITSLALSIEPQRVLFQTFIPVEEIKAVLKQYR